MAAKPIHFRDFATLDLDTAAGHYLVEGGAATATRFVDAVEAAAQRVSKNPRLGSPRLAYELSVPDLRVMPVGKFPYLLFYVEYENSVDVWRLLHTSRDVPASLQDPNT